MPETWPTEEQWTEDWPEPTPEAQPMLGEDGATFLLDTSATVEAVWGQDVTNACLWAKGEPFYIFAAPGVGKSTLVQQLVLRRMGLREKHLLRYPVRTSGRQVLYVAGDRPSQVQRSFRRMVTEEDRPALADSLVFAKGPPPFMVSSRPSELLPWIKGHGENIGTVVIDSLFNVAPSLSDEEGAARTNLAFQTVVADGIELVGLHHDRKRDAHSREKVHMDDMYGGRPLSGGAGSIAYLDGESNELSFKMRFVKSPAGRVNTIEAAIMPRTGEVVTDDGPF